MLGVPGSKSLDELFGFFIGSEQLGGNTAAPMDVVIRPVRSGSTSDPAHTGVVS